MYKKLKKNKITQNKCIMGGVQLKKENKANGCEIY
jgi:hypothetical protein